MHRIALAALAFIALPAIAHADGVSVADQYQWADKAFFGGATDSSDFGANYIKQVLTGIDGKWTAMQASGPVLMDKYVTTSCKARGGVTIATNDAYSLTITRFPGTDDALASRFTVRGGSSFGVATDVGQLAKVFHLTGDAMANQLIQFSAQFNGVVNIWRPSADILVVEPETSGPQIYVRCPAT